MFIPAWGKRIYWRCIISRCNWSKKDEKKEKQPSQQKRTEMWCFLKSNYGKMNVEGITTIFLSKKHTKCILSENGKVEYKYTKWCE